MSSTLNFLLAVACGAIAANIYYSQPLVGVISEAVNLPVAWAGLIVTLTQVGYGLGVLLVVPLGDLLENRKLILTSIGIVVVALFAASLSQSYIPFLVAALAIGVSSSAVQVIIPYAASLSTPLARGRVVGNCTSGVMVGIMASRPTASFITNTFGWHYVFYISSGLMILLFALLYQKLPKRIPSNKNLNYGQILFSMGKLFADTPILRRRGFYQGCQFGAFSIFWTTIPLILAKEFHLSQMGIAFFALAGVAGAVSAPICGRLADRGWSRFLTGLGLLSVAVAFLLTHVGTRGTPFSLGVFVLSGILLDAGVSANLVLGQRAIFSLDEDSRGRLNGLYIAMIFIGGAIGSAVGAWVYAQGGWKTTSWFGFSLPILGLILFSTEVPVFSSKGLAKPLPQSE